jgi:hypothetical protein
MSNEPTNTDTDTDELDDTEGNCFKYRYGQPVGRPDDTQGHSAKSGHLQPEGDDTDGHGQHNPG